MKKKVLVIAFFLTIFFLIEGCKETESESIYTRNSVEIRGATTIAIGDSLWLEVKFNEEIENQNEQIWLWDFDDRDGLSVDSEGSQVSAFFLIAGRRVISLRNQNYPDVLATHLVEVISETQRQTCFNDHMCSDQTICNGIERCVENQCESGTALQVDDENLCTEDHCDPEMGVIHTLIEPNDNDLCTVDSCDSETGEISHIMRDCGEDGFCDENTGQCLCYQSESDQSDLCEIAHCDQNGRHLENHCYPGTCHLLDGEIHCSCPLNYISDGVFCVPPCETPFIPVLSPIAATEILVFSDRPESNVEIQISSFSNDWIQVSEVHLTDYLSQNITINARYNACPNDVFEATYLVHAHYPGREEYAIENNSSLIQAWAKSVEEYVIGENVLPIWQTPNEALGFAEGAAANIVSLGEGGSIILGFEPPIYDDFGADFAVFENATIEGFLELGYVEISSDGEHFARFDHAYLGELPRDTFALLDPKEIGGFAGRD